MARINIPLDALTSRLNLSGRFDSEFFDLKRLSKPANFGEVQSRVNYNLGYFSSNYAAVLVMLSIYSLLTNLLLLFVIVLVAGGMFGIGKLQGADLDVGFAKATSSQLYTGLFIIAVPLFIWASPISTVLWLVGASGVTILGHAAFMDKVRCADCEKLKASVPIADGCAAHRVSFFRGGGLGGRPRAPYSSPLYGRPPGALRDGRVRRRPYPADWEPRHSQRYDERLYELESDEDDGQGVVLDSAAYGYSRDGRRFASDELYFTGYDLGAARDGRSSGRGSYEDLQDYAYSDEEEPYENRDYRGTVYQAAVRDKEEALIQSALERIGRARAKGKSNVNLTPEEMEALERRKLQPSEPSPSPPISAPAPATPSKTKGKSSRSSSLASIQSEKSRKTAKPSKSLFGPTSPAATKSGAKAKVTRKPSAEQALPYAPGTAPPGIMVAGPNGVPIYAPIGYYPPPSPEYLRSQSGGSRPGSRSTSKTRRREATPPDGQSYPPRYYPPVSAGMRPPSSSSNRSMPDDIDWYPPPPRNRSTSNAAYYRESDGYGPPPVPAAQGRRNVSGPPDVSYSTLRRMPPSSPLAQRFEQGSRPGPHASLSDPMVQQRKGSALSQEVESSSSDDDQGVQVEIVPEASGNGYGISRIPASGSENRRRKGRR